MKYMGSKARVGKHIAPLLIRALSDSNNYVEPFCGGMNMMQFIPESINRYGNDYNYYIVAMWYKLLRGWVPPCNVSKEFYESCKALKQEAYVVGYVGINCSYSGKWFGGYAGKTKTKDGSVRDYQLEAFNNTLKQVENLKGVKVCSKSYNELDIPNKSVIYCDPPYANTTGYKDSFDHTVFWSWCRSQIATNHIVFVSEYSAPDDFVCVWQQEVKSSLSANGASGGSKVSIEKLFMHESQAYLCNNQN